jgi:hypothetical protein
VGKGLWDNVDGFMSDLAAYFTNLDAGEGARRSAEIFGVDKARFLGDFVNEQEKGGRKFVRDFRLDRIGSTAPMDFRARISEDAIQKSKLRWMPAETIGDKSIINSDEGYRIISGAKHKLYGPDGKLIGIYDTQTQAERKADATQARLQPEVRQQQRPLGDEGRQTAEAGGGNRALGGAEGGQEGRQADRTVRQAGNVRFMPDGTSDGLAVLDDVLKLELPRRPKVIDIANAFQNMFGKAIEYRKSNPQDNARLVNLLVQEIDRAVKLHPEAKGWYDENVKLTMDVMRDLDPDLAKPENDFIFKAILAATSDGNKVGPQFQQTWKEYSNWKNTGEISGEFVSGDRIENIQTNLEMLNEFIKDIGWEKTKDFMVQKGTVKDLRQALVDVFGWTKKQANSIGSSERVDEVVPFAVVLGPKLGSFFNNLYGDFSSVTMDRWFMRTLGRLTGTQVAPLSKAKLREMRNNLRDAVARLTPSEFEMLGVKRGDLKGTSIDGAATTISGRFSKKALRETAKKSSEAGQSALEETRKFANALKKGLNPLVEAPVDGTHRRWIRERIAEVQSELRSRGIELENADLQAVLWYLEKELYEKLNYRSKSGESDYASAASSLYQSVAGRPSDVYAGGTGRVRAIGSTGGSEGMGAGQASQAAGPEVGAQRFMPAGDMATGRGVKDHREAMDLFEKGYRLYGALYDGMEDPIRLKKASEIERFDPENLWAVPSKKIAAAISVRNMPASDTDYLSAVKAGDTATAQRMVDEAAKAAGYTIGPVYHGTPTGGFNVFDKRMRGETSGVSRQAFSFTTDKKAAEGYSKRLGDEAVRLDAGLRVANDAMRMFDEDVAAQEYFSSKGYSSVDDGMLPEFDWGSIDDVPEFIKELRGYAKDLKPINKRLSDSFIEAAKVMTSTKAVPEVKRVFLRIPEGAPVFQATPQTLGQVMSGFSAENQPTKAGIVELPGNERIYYVADSSQVKLVDAITKDDAGNIIPLSQRFKATSEDIRYMPQPDSAMPGAYSFPGGYRAIPGKTKGSFRLYGPAGSLIGIASSLDEAQRILRRKAKQ